MGRDPWRNGTLQLLLDPNNTRGEIWDYHSLGHRQLIQDVKGQHYSYPQEFSDQCDPYWRQTSMGYFFEVRIPWGALGEDIEAAPGLPIGFDVANDGLDAGSKAQFTYTGRVEKFLIPRAFSRLVLQEATSARTESNDQRASALSKHATYQLAVYPNPLSRGAIQLKLSGFEEAEVQIVDARGTVVYQATHSEPSIRVLRRFSRGLYVVRVSDARKTLTRRLLVE